MKIRQLTLSLVPSQIHGYEGMQVEITLHRAGMEKVSYRKHVPDNDFISRFDYMIEDARHLIKQHIKAEAQKNADTLKDAL